MKRILTTVLILFTAGFLFADFKVTETENIYRMNSNGEEKLMSSAEYYHWIAAGKIAFQADNWKFIFDFNNKKLTVIDYKEKYYAETPLPLNVTRFLTARSYIKANERSISGDVRKTRRKKKLLDMDCVEYNLTFWEAGSDKEETSQHGRVWATTAVPFDWKLQATMMRDIRKILSRDAHFRQELEKIEGFQLRTELLYMLEKSRMKTVNFVTSIEEIKGGNSLYSVPSDFEKRDTIDANTFLDNF